ncbi:histidine triad nucleotide-binding protein [Patescibacteria group bacterium]
MADCVFCKIISGDIPSKKVYEDDKVIAFHDIDPQAPVHVLIIPKRHIVSLNEFTNKEKELLGEIVLRIPKIAKDLSIDQGYKVVINNGKDAGQIVPHVHIHILGGKSLQGVV